MSDPPPFLRRKSHFMAIYWLVQALVAYVLSIMLLASTEGDESFVIWMAPLLLTSGLLLLQWIFLLPIRKPASAVKAVPIFLSLAVAAFYMCLLFGAFVLAVTDTLGTYEFFDYDDLPAPLWLMLLAIVGAAWLVSTPLLIFFCRKSRDAGVLQRIASGLFLGSILEAAAIIPLDILVRRRSECICATGTFFSLVVCGTIGLAAFGPAIFLPLMLPHRKRWYGRLCDVCGYDMRGNTGAERCPECGAGWREAKTHKPTDETPHDQVVDSA